MKLTDATATAVIGEPIKQSIMVQKLEIDFSEETKNFLLELSQAKSVVKCRECDREFGSPVCPIKSKGWAINEDTFFCAWGERKEP